MKQPLPRFTDARALQREAEKLFEAALPADRFNDIKIPQEKDFGLDYRVEYIREGAVTSAEFYAQVKGFRKIHDLKRVGIRAKASTVRYWQGKILPVLLVVVDCTSQAVFCQWFDKAAIVPDGTETVTLRFTHRFALTSAQLEKTLTAYYQSFAQDFFEAKRYSFYRELYQMAVGGLDMICRATLMLLEAEAAKSEKHEEKAMRYYVVALSILVHDARLERVDVDLGGNEVDQSVERLLHRLATIHSDLVITRQDQGAVSYLTVRSDRVRHSLPFVWAIFSELAWFFHHRFLGRPRKTVDSSGSVSQPTR
ncbi:MAG TPA: DUF4365 domain-containing protein [Candidatus Angelobacter sp.]